MAPGLASRIVRIRWLQTERYFKFHLIHLFRKTGLHATEQIRPGAIKRFAKPSEHFHTRVSGSCLNSLKLPAIYLRLVGKLFLRQTQRHPQPVDVSSKDLPSSDCHDDE
jgi:hypothetical protein